MNSRHPWLLTTRTFRWMRTDALNRVILLGTLVGSLFGCEGFDEFKKEVKKKTAEVVADKTVDYTVDALKSMGKTPLASESRPAQPPEIRQSSATAQPSSGPPSPADPRLTALANGPFGGITVIELYDAERRFLVVYVSPEGTYASFGSYTFGVCIAWLNDSQSDPASLTFGSDDPSSKRLNVNLFPRPVCDPFTVKYQDPETVRLIQGKSNQKQKIVARIPLGTPDWSFEVFSRHSTNEVRLGPVDLDSRGGTKSGAPFNPASLQSGYLKQFIKRLDATHAIHGYVAAREITGWPSDVLVMMWGGIKLSQRSSGAAFNEAIREKYGDPSLRSDGMGYWIYDLRGRLLRERDGNSENCIGTFELWKDKLRGGLMAHEDIGPWGCTLVMKHSTGDGQAAVSEYEVEAASGLGWSLGHFRARLAEARRYKEAVAANQPVKPRL